MSTGTDAAREAARNTDGKFGTQPLGEANGVDLSLPLPAVSLTAREVEHLVENKGRFADGYDEGDVNSVLGAFGSARLVCVWTDYDSYGFGGDSEFAGIEQGSQASGSLGVGRAVPADRGPWRSIHPDVWEYLSDPDSDIDPETIPSLLADQPFERQDINDLSGDGSNNVAIDYEESETCAADDCGESLDDGEGYDGYCGTCADIIEQHREGDHEDEAREDCPEC